MKKAVIIVPTYNESANITRLISAITHHIKHIRDWQIEVLVVDSTSPDGTAGIVRELAQSHSLLHLLETPKEGLGRAYLRGMRHAIDHLHAQVVFEMDADLSHDPVKIGDFLAHIDAGADFVIGTRYDQGGSIPTDWGIDRKFFSILGNWILRIGFMRLRNTEWTNGYRAIRSELVRQIIPQMEGYTGYVFQVAFLDRAIQLGAKIDEIPIQFRDRTHGHSKINARQYSMQTLMYMLSHSSFVKFCFVGLSGLLVDVGVAALGWRVLGLPIITANRISMETAVVSNYLLNNFWVFGAHRHTSWRHHVSAFAKFNLVALGSFVLQELGIRLGIMALGEQYSLIYKLATITLIVIPYSYILYNKVIWRKKKSSSPDDISDIAPAL